MKRANTKLLFAIFLLVGILMTSAFVIAKPDTPLVLSTNDQSGVSVIIPAHAVQVADNVFSLGESRDVNGKMVEGFLFIYYKKENAKPQWAGQGQGGGGKCYEFLSKGAKWKTTESYITGFGIDPILTEASLNAWDSEVSFNIFGPRITSATPDGADSVSPDGKNEVEFQNLGQTNTIAYTIVWGIFSGPPGQRELVEWDAVFNSAYAWSEIGETGKMDYQNIATHEFGHALGLGHPQDNCAEETMYAYANYGETKKRDLYTGDIVGINKLYS